ncbi:MAG: hypothetical protein N3C58_08480, partial [Meiothermus ruber]|nr:hypothetical protein [Meiothermus ruber]
ADLIAVALETSGKVSLSEVKGEDLVPQAMQRALTPPPKPGSPCPECGEAALVREEGCVKCYSCGYSKCG